MSESQFFPRPRQVRYRQRSVGEPVRFPMSVPPDTDVIVRREAGAAGVSLAAFYQTAALRLAGQTYDEREKGLLPIPGTMASEELDLIQRHADASGMSVARWVSHALMDAVSRRSLPEEDTETAEKNSTRAAA